MDIESRVNHLSRSIQLLERAGRIIPGQTNTISKRITSLGGDANYPAYAASAAGCRIIDVDGNTYIDYVAALAPIILGYGNPAVNEAIRTQLDAGILFSLPSENEVILSERLCDVIPSAERGRLFKTGAEAVSAAVRCARLYTGREVIVSCGYSGWHDWWACTQSGDGIPAAIQALTKSFEFDDLDGARSLMAEIGNAVAAVVVTPALYGRNPAPGFLEGLRELCDRSGAMLIFDEIITGFRWSLSGAQGVFGVLPDLTALGKAMANGMPIAALVGRAAPMQKLATNWVTSTNASEALSIAAALATIGQLSEAGFYDRLYARSEATVSCIRRAAQASGIEVRLSEALPAIRFGFADPHCHLHRSVFLNEMVREGVLIRPDKDGFSLCFMDAHDDETTALTEHAFEVAFAKLRASL